MQFKTWIQIISGTLIAGIFAIVSYLIKDTQAIWLETRILGIAAFLTLFAVVLLGELRLLAKDKSTVTLFRYHKPLGIFAAYLVFLHLISALADNYKWGKSYTFVQYLGFSFSDKWLVFLSFGALAFYLMLLLGMTSATPSIRKIGFRNWKLIHFLSYVAFFIAYIHSVNLGTDLNHSIISSWLMPIFIMMFILVLGLLLTRIINHFPVFEDQIEVNLGAILVIIMIVVASLIAAQYVRNEDKLISTTTKINDAQTGINTLNREIQTLNKSIKTSAATLNTIK